MAIGTCSKCGGPLEQGVTSCPECGEAVKKSESVKPAVSKAPVDVQKAKNLAKSPKGKLGAVGVIAVLLAVIGIALFVFLKKDSPDDYSYKLTVTDATITGLKNKDLETLKIPSSIDDVPVTIIGDRAFVDSTSITSVELPASIKTIGGAAFSGCTSLTKVNVPNSVSSIGAYAFAKHYPQLKGKSKKHKKEIKSRTKYHLTK